MSRAEARDFLFKYAIPYCADEIRNARAASVDALGVKIGGNFPNTVEGIALVDANYTTMPKALKDAANAALTTRRGQQAGVMAPLRGLLNAALAWYGQEIGSSYADGGNVSSESGIFFDVRADQDTNNEYVAGRGITRGSNPAAGSGVVLRRLTVDHQGQKIESGAIETVTFEVVQTSITGAGVRQVNGTLYGEDGPDDALDRQDKGTARAANVTMTLFNEVNRGAIQNATFAVSGSPANGTAVTSSNLQSWTLSDVAGTPTVVVRTTNPWRSKVNGVAVSGNSTTKRFEQALVIPSNDDGTPNAYTPVDHLTVVYWDATWTGNITMIWGSKSEVFAHTLFSGAGFKYLLPTLDEDLYPVNFSTTDPKYALEIATTSASGEIVLHYSDVQRMRPRQGCWFSAWSHDSDPAEGAKFTWTDTNDHTGKLQDTIAEVYEFAPYAYFNTSGSSLQSPASRAPEIEVSYGGAAIADGVTIDLGSVAAGDHDVTIRIQNDGNAPLAVGVPADGGGTNATLFDPGLSQPAVVMPGDYLDVTMVVQDGGVGAFSQPITIQNNDATEDPYDITVIGTAT